MSVNYCFKCGDQLCTCGDFYKSIDKNILLKAMFAIASELKSKNVDISVTVDNKDLKDVVYEIGTDPLFDKNSLELISKAFPAKWMVTIKNFNTVEELMECLNKQSEDTFPLVGILSYMIHYLLLKRKKKDTVPLFISLLKHMYDHGSVVRDVIESGNPIAPSFNVLSEAEDLETEDKRLYYFISKYVSEDMSPSIDYQFIIFCRFLIMRACSDSSSPYVDVKTYEDELYYEDESLFEYMKNKNIPIEFKTLKLT